MSRHAAPTGVTAIIGPALRLSGRATLAAALAGLAIVAALALPGPVVGRGWLLAWLVWSGVPVGATVLLMIHALVGGRWGVALDPVLRPGAALMPLAALAFLPVATHLSAIYPWAADPGAAPPEVARLYLNAPAFLVRAGVTLVGWTLLGLVMATGRGGRLFAGIGLAFYGLTVSLVAVDWVLSLDPGYVATAFGTTFALGHLLMALATTAFAQPATIGKADEADLAGLLTAVTLGVVYLGLMTFVVAWYGDQNAKAAWYAARSGPGWLAVLIAALGLGALLPFGLLLGHRARRDPRVLWLAGAGSLAGATLHLAWLTAPHFEGAGACLAVATLVLAGAAAFTAVWLGLWRLADREQADG